MIDFTMPGEKLKTVMELILIHKHFTHPEEVVCWIEDLYGCDRISEPQYNLLLDLVDPSRKFKEWERFILADGYKNPLMEVAKCDT